MGSTEKSNPSTAIGHLRGEFDQVPEHSQVEPNASNQLPVESFIDGDSFVVQIRLPGVDPKDIDLQVADEVLKIKASLFRDKIRYGSFEKAISLPPGIKAKHLNSVHQDGVLELRAAIPWKSSANEMEKKPPGGK